MAVRRKCEQCHRNRAAKFFTSQRGRVCSFCRKGNTRRASRGQYLWDKYGLTLDEYEAMRDEQGGVCFICQRKPRYNLAVDHDHKVEKALVAQGMNPRLAVHHSIRGLLCKPCNGRLLTAAGDDPARLNRAIVYLLEPPAYDVLEGVLKPWIS